MFCQLLRFTCGVLEPGSCDVGGGGGGAPGLRTSLRSASSIPRWTRAVKY